MFISPVAYSVELIPQGLWRILYGINPLTGVIQGFRWALLGGSPPDEFMGVSVFVVGVLLFSGLFYFKRMEKTFADVV
jgi:lipopolysaccharide transport system permease protein